MSTMPEGLSSRASKFWQDMITGYSFSLSEVLLLERICKEISLIDYMESDITLSQLRSTGSMGQDIADPLLGELRQHTALLNTLIKSMKLPDVSSTTNTVNRAKNAANARWGERGKLEAVNGSS